MMIIAFYFDQFPAVLCDKVSDDINGHLGILGSRVVAVMHAL